MQKWCEERGALPPNLLSNLGVSDMHPFGSKQVPGVELPADLPPLQTVCMFEF